MLLVAAAAGAAPKGRGPVRAGPAQIEVAVVWRRALVRYRVEGDRLIVREPPDEVVVDRQLRPDERARLWNAAEPCLKDGETQFKCDRNEGEETFISVATDRDVTWTALCSQASDDRGRSPIWLALLDTVRVVSGRGLPSEPGR